MTTAKEANAALGFELVRALREGDGCVPEADADLNEASRRLIHAVAEQNGEAWLAKFNRWKEDRGGPAVWKWDGGTVYNFSSDCVLPAYDAELERLILERERTPIKSVREDVPRVEAILERVRAAGGFTLVWS